MIKLNSLVIKSTREIPAPAWPPSGSWTMCARLYVNTSEDHICMNTVSWYFDGGSSYTYSDPDCNNYLDNLSQWNDSTEDTYLPISGQDSNGKYVNIFTNGEGGSVGNPWDFCVILANGRVNPISDDSWAITKVDVIAANSSTYYSYDNPNSPYQGQWLRNNDVSNWTQHQVSGGGSIVSTIFRPLAMFIPEPVFNDYRYFLWHVEEDETGEYMQQDFALSTDGTNKITGFTCLAGVTSSNPSTENYPNGFDGNSNTKWYSSGTYPNWVIFTNNNEINPVGFWYMTSNDQSMVPERAPSKYKLCGTNTLTTNPNDSSWVTLIDTTSTGDNTFTNSRDNYTWIYKSFQAQPQPQPSDSPEPEEEE